MTMNLFDYQESVIKSGLLIQFMHLKFSSYKERTKTPESTVGKFCQKLTLTGANKLRLQQNVIRKIRSRETYNPGSLVGDHLSTVRNTNIQVTQFFKTHGISYCIVRY